MHPSTEQARKLAEDHCKSWTDCNAEKVAQRYSEPTSFAMNHGDAMTSRKEVVEMAAGFMADFPDLLLVCDTVLVAGRHMVYAWTFSGTHAGTGKSVKFSGWEEWDLDDDLQVTRSLGWYDVEDYERQVEGRGE